MKFKNVFYGSLAIVASATLILLNTTSVEETAKYAPRTQNYDLSYFDNLQGIAGAMEYYIERRKNIKTGKIELADMLEAERAIANFDKTNTGSSKQALDFDWLEMGPDNVGGRTRALMVDKNNPGKLWAGSVGGGLFVSYTSGLSWSPINDNMDNLSIGCICQSKDGDIYVGTGERFTGNDGAGTLYTPGFLGRGLFKSTDGVNFAVIDSTVPTTFNSTGTPWTFISRCATDPFDNDLIYAATNRGLLYTTDGGTNWINAICLNPPTCSSFSQANFEDVKIGSNGVVVASSGGTTYLKKPGATEFVKLNSHFTVGSRFEFAISPSNPDYIYVVAASSTGGYMGGLWKTTDGGDNWEIQVPAGPGGIFSDQANYDMAIAVFPDDPDHVIVGGVELWALSGKNNTWDLIALTQPFAQGLYVHADKHAFAFPPNYNGTTVETFYIGCDGGVYGSYDGGSTYVELNSGYNVTQFYAIGNSREGWVAGGTQDNGNPYIDFTGNTELAESRNLPSGDGGYMQFSVVDPKAVFWESQSGNARRSPESGNGGGGGFFADAMCPGGNCGAWVTPLVIWESFNDLTSKDSVKFVAKQAHNAGTEIFVPSGNADYPFKYVTPVPLSVNDTVMIQDIIQTKFIAGAGGGTWMCKNILDFSVSPAWYKISNQAYITAAEFSKDGDIAYVSTGLALYRISGLLGILPSDAVTDPNGTGNPAIPASCSSTLLYNGSQFVTGIGVDPNNSENVVITLGNYGNSNANHVYVSSNAASATNAATAAFTSVQGNLPTMPCYDAIIEMTDSNTIVVATEYGVWSTENAWASPSSVIWVDENNMSFPRVPSFMITQQTHPNSSCTGVTTSGNIYVGTHGRGIWRTEKYLAGSDTADCALPISIAEGPSKDFDLKLGVYPNPVSDGNVNVTFTLSDNADVELTVYNISGVQLTQVTLKQQVSGNNTVDLDVSSLKAGTYFVSITSNRIRRTTRLVVL